jgi:sterol desaturase/sphingolipid hydroxylase (fatty acid hydroxylase superfamily)
MLYFAGNIQKLKRYRRTTAGFFTSLFSTQMTSVTFLLDYYTYPVFILTSILAGYWVLGRPVGWWFAPALMATGYAVWTLVEYLMHRFAFHRMPYVMDLHMAHHRDVNGMIGTPTILSFSSMFVLGYLPMAMVIGAAYACFWFAGFMTGYLAFSSVHYMVHHVSSGGFAVIRKSKRAHAIHHHGSNSHNFGVTTLIWDRVFGTYRDKMN